MYSINSSMIIINTSALNLYLHIINETFLRNCNLRNIILTGPGAYCKLYVAVLEGGRRKRVFELYSLTGIARRRVATIDRTVRTFKTVVERVAATVAATTTACTTTQLREDRQRKYTNIQAQLDPRCV